MKCTGTFWKMNLMKSVISQERVWLKKINKKEVNIAKLINNDSSYYYYFLCINAYKQFT